MKGLLLKDFYQFLKYGKSILVIVFTFTVLSFFGSDNLFITIYPCVFVSNLAVSLIAYDENDKWDIYSLTLPFKRAQLVSAKFIFGLLFGFSTIALLMVPHIFRMVMTGTFSVVSLMTLLSTLLLVSFLPAAVQFLITYRYGSGKARIMFIALVVVLCGGLYGFFQSFSPVLSSISSNVILPISTLGCGALILYGISWILSIKIYEKKDL